MTSVGDICVGAENRSGGKEIGSRQFGGKGRTNFLKKHSREMSISLEVYKVNAFCICADGFKYVSVAS